MADMPSPHGRSVALDELCDYAAARRHHELRLDVRRVADLLRTLSDDGPPTPQVIEQYEDLATFLELHLAKEENILFPALVALAEAARAGQPRPPLPFPSVLNPVRLLEVEHARLHELLDRLRAVTAELAVPAEAGEPWRRAYEALASLDAALAEHVRFENEVLFPQALEVERQLG